MLYQRNTTHVFQMYNHATFFRPISWWSSGFKPTLNHYEALNVKPDCTPKELREAFIKLCKENHPDVNKRTSAHEKFQRINEAYKVLSKPYSRMSYDFRLSNESKDYTQYLNSAGHVIGVIVLIAAGYLLFPSIIRHVSKLSNT